MKKRYADKKNNYITIISIFIVVCVALLSIGWSAFQSTFNINNLYATVRVDKDIRVTNVYAYSATNSGRSNYEEYDVHSIYGSVYLPNQNSTVTYRVKVTNVGNVMQGIYDIEEIYKIVGTNTDSDLEIKSTTITLKEALCSNQNSSLCENGSVTTFDIEIGYKANGYDGTHQTHAVTLNFDFRRVFGITYNGFGNTSGLANTMIQGDTKTITFNSTTGIPGNTTTTGATGNYNSTTHQLTLSNITLTGLNDVITVSRHYKITYSGFTGSNVSNLPDNIIYTGGTIQIPSGVDYPDSVAITNASGSYNSTTHVITISNITNDITITATYNSSGGGSGTPSDPYIVHSGTYDPDDVTDPGVTKFDTAPGAPQVTATTDSQGNTVITSFEYTNSSSTNPVVFTPGDSVETGVLAMDGAAFTIHIKFKADLSLASNNGKFIFAALQYDSSTDKYSGFSLFDYNSGYLRVGVYRDRPRSTNTGLLTPNNYITYNSTALTGEKVYDVTVTYDPQGNKSKYGLITFTTTVNGASAATKTMKNTKPAGNSGNNIPETLTNAVVTIGGSGISINEDMGNMEVYEFSVTRN